MLPCERPGVRRKIGMKKMIAMNGLHARQWILVSEGRGGRAGALASNPSGVIVR